VEAGGYLKGKGYDVGMVDKYVPTTMLQGSDLALAIDGRRIELNKLASKGVVSEDYKKALSELHAVAAHVSKSLNIKAPDFSDLNKHVDVLINDVLAGSRKLGTSVEASASFAIEGELPTFVRELDMGKLMMGYLNNNFKAAHIDVAMKKLSTEISVLERIGAKEGADYFKKVAFHTLGGKSGWGLDIQRKVNEMAYSSAKVLSDPSASLLAKGAAKAESLLPDFISYTNQMIYPAFLAFNTKATVRNYFQAVAKTAPELGGGYGYKLSTQGMLDAIASKAKGEDIAKTLTSRNLLSGHVRAEALTETKTFVSKTSAAVDWVNNKSMYFYSKSDEHNRFITIKIGERWAKDLLASDSDAIKALAKAPAGVKNAIKANDLIDKGDEKALAEVLIRSLIGRTQFNYDKVQLNEFAREHGKLFSMFTKWPIMTGSDIAEMYNNGGFKKGTYRMTEKYLAPLMALGAVQYAIDSNIKDPAALKYTLGDLKDLSPLASMTGMLKGSVGSPLLRGTASTAAGAIEMVGGEGWKEGGVLKNIGVMTGSVVSGAAKQTAKTLIPVASPILNELDRFQKVYKGETFTTKFMRKHNLTPEN
jgi:hypothetical protein